MRDIFTAGKSKESAQSLQWSLTLLSFGNGGSDLAVSKSLPSSQVSSTTSYGRLRLRVGPARYVGIALSSRMIVSIKLHALDPILLRPSDKLGKHSTITVRELYSD